MQKVKTIIFDLDGTLVNTIPAIVASLSSFLSELLKREVSEAEVREKFVSDMAGMAEAFGISLDDKNEVAELWKRWKSHQRDFIQDSSLFGGVLDLLKSLKAQKTDLYLWTARDRQGALALLEEHGIMAYFKDIRCADDTAPKPSPEGLFELIGEQREGVLFVGDSTTDYEGSQVGGVSFLAAGWDEMCPRDYFMSKGVQVAKHPKEVMNWRESHV